MAQHDTARDAILRFYADCGVSAHLGDVPHNAFERPAQSPSVAAPPRSTPLERNPHEPPPATPAGHPPFSHGGTDKPEVEDARALAGRAADLATLHGAIHALEGCPLKATAQRTCNGEGPLGAPLMFVGEAPGREEDAVGRPFVGRSGKLLDKMITAIGLAREDVYITNVIPWRPPGNRTPSPIETATCEAFVRREIALVAPKILVPLGGPAAKTLLRNDAGIMRQRGRWTRYLDEAGLEIDALAMFHPAYLLRAPAEKRRAWQDLIALRLRLDAL